MRRLHTEEVKRSLGDGRGGTVVGYLGVIYIMIVEWLFIFFVIMFDQCYVLDKRIDGGLSMENGALTWP